MSRPLYSPAVVREILGRHGLTAKKGLGQNFLIDGNVLGKILAAVNPGPGDQVLEIGPGLGVLTQALAQTAGRVVAVEIDPDMIAVLRENLEDLPHVCLVNQDALEVDLNEILQGWPGPIKVAANLPYYVTTPILFRLLESGLPFETLVFLVQKEVAQRIVARPGGKEYGVLTVGVQYHCQAEIVSIVPASVFLPQPDVDSAIIKLTRREEKAAPLPVREFMAVVRAAFSQRRKTLRNNLKELLDPQSLHKIEEAGISLARRAETLSISEFALLALLVKEELNSRSEP